MFIRKKKVLKEIEAMVEDSMYWIEFLEAKGESSVEVASKLRTAITELDALRYFILNNERWRELRERK